MNKHEDKYCPRCSQLFECKVGNIVQCHCYGMILSDEEKNEITKNYNDCLCNSCLTALKKEFALAPKHLPLQK